MITPAGFRTLPAFVVRICGIGGDGKIGVPGWLENTTDRQGTQLPSGKMRIG